MSGAKTMNRTTGLLTAGMFVLATIGIIVVIRRILVMNNTIASFNPSGGAPFDTGFSIHKWTTYLHILPAALLMVLGPFQFMPRIRAYHIKFHRTSGGVFIIAAYIVGLSAISMPLIMLPVGGLNEAAASIFYGIFFLLSVSKAWWSIYRKNVTLHREWMIRTFAIGLAVSTIRPIIALFFAFCGQPPQVFFGTAFWIGFTLHLIVAEVWINYTRKPN
ncbi:MAG: putative rane protein [Segetibacter sp.]|nr:putative rane protein [Segetibacter sp.]